MSNVQAAFRAAAVDFIEDYATSVSLGLATYRARPEAIFPPQAFVDLMGETIVPIGQAAYQRTPTVELLVIHGLFDQAETVDQRDAFVDGFVDWTRDRVHQAGGNTLIAAATVRDEPTWVPDWLHPEYQLTYYATRIILEGYVGDN